MSNTWGQGPQRVREDMRAFAQWRQTEDGKDFVAWALNATAVTLRVDEMDREWRTAWSQWRQYAVSPAEWSEWSEWCRQYYAPPASSSKALVPLGVGLMAVGGFLLLIGLLSPSMLILGFVVGAGGLALMLAPTLQRSSLNQRTQAQQAAVLNAQARRVAHFGFDPITTPEPNEDWTRTSRDYLNLLAETIENGFQYHTHRGDLPNLIDIEVVAPSAIRNPALREVASRWSRDEKA